MLNALKYILNITLNILFPTWVVTPVTHFSCVNCFEQGYQENCKLHSFFLNSGLQYNIVCYMILDICAVHCIKTAGQNVAPWNKYSTCEKAVNICLQSERTSLSIATVLLSACPSICSRDTINDITQSSTPA